ncbi:cAMP-regulated phosphoprotein 19-A-like [Clavelina lepadiformis]|uniref:cAMP-regulated phosphoprotein 19 n=1 Tax=Clavelina lepadiformis TaxID=159417 RepID=A0ABP0GRX1_CLALP
MSGSPDLVPQDEPQAPFKTPSGIERQQEEMLKSKYPNLKPKGGSSLLQKRMQQKTKYFDSGDYNMARAKMKSKQEPPPEVKQLNQVTGDHMPTPDEIPRVRKQSQSNLVISSAINS